MSHIQDLARSNKQLHVFAPDSPLTSDALLNALPIGVYLCDRSGYIVGFNSSAEKLWGRRPAIGQRDQQFCGALRLFNPDGTPLPHAETPMAQVLRTGSASRDNEVIIERPDGTRVTVMADIEPLHDADGQMVGAVNCFRDITQTKEAAAGLAASERRLSEILHGISVAVYTTDEDGRLTFYNQAAARLWGVEPELNVARWCGSHALAHTDGSPMRHDECPMAVAIKTGEAICGQEARLVRPDGQQIPFLAYPTPFKDEQGRVTGAVNMMVDISELSEARDARKSSEQFKQQLLESSQDCVKVLDREAHLISINDCGRRYLEIDKDSPITGANYLEFWQGEHRTAAENAVRQALGGKPGRFTASFMTPSGRMTWWDEVVTPVRDARGNIAHLLVVSRDISERRASEEQKELLIDELNHRVKNTLATVQSIAMHTFRSEAIPTETVKLFESRLIALSRAHNHLSAAGWQSADFKSVVSEVLCPFASEDDRKLRLRGPSVWLAPRQTVMLAMVLHELATNAAKYGSLSVPGGRLSVTWSVRETGEGQQLRVNWLERGGPEVRKPSRKGFGTSLIDKGVALELNGKTRIRYEPEGLRCTLHVPIQGKPGL